jgi:hypothetical protein
MQRCHEIFGSSADIEARRRAVELLRVVADRRALCWVPEYLSDPDRALQFRGAGIVDQLLYSGLAELDECEPILELMSTHPHEKIREQYEALMQVRADLEMD